MSFGEFGAILGFYKYSQPKLCMQVYERIKDPIDTIKAHCMEPSGNALKGLNTREAKQVNAGQASTVRITAPLL